MKIKTKGRWLWARTIGSTIVGQGLDTLVFITLAFIGTPSFVVTMILYHWLAKTGIEVIATPFTYTVVNFLKKKEAEVIATPFTYTVVNFLKKKEAIDTYDYQTRFNPFLVSD